MKTSFGHLVQFLLYSSAASALPEIAIAKYTHANSNPARHKRRQNVDAGEGTLETNTFGIFTWAAGGVYHANVTVGTPPQDQLVILDTGSSDLYFDSSAAPACQTNGWHSCRGGTYNRNASITYKMVAEYPAFNASFADGSTAIGPYAQDTIGIGDVSIPVVQFGVADHVNSTVGFAVGLMGLGYSHKEFTNNVYPNVPDILVSSGEIASRLYSIHLNDVESTSGSILFGGIDRSKYAGPLTTFNLLPNAWYRTVDFITTVTALFTNVSSHTSAIFTGGTDSVTAYNRSSANPALPVLIDTGAAAWYLPPDQYSRLMMRFPYVNPTTRRCDCKHRDSNDSLTLTFAERLNITVPASQFIVPIYERMTNRPRFLDDTKETQMCLSMIAPQRPWMGRYFVLGDAILRSIYTVYDLDNGQVSMAQAAVGSDARPDIVPVAAGPGGVQSAAGLSSKARTQNRNEFPSLKSLSSQIWSIYPTASGDKTFSASRLGSTVGLATGIDALPTDARPVQTESVRSHVGNGRKEEGEGVEDGSGEGAEAASSSAGASEGAGSELIAGLMWPGGAASYWTFLAFGVGVGVGMMML